LINSMTGFGRGSAENEFHNITVELKAVNHRFCEINPHMPKQFSFCEEQLKKWVAAEVNRGKIDIFISFERTQTKNSVLKVDKELAIAYYKAISDIADTCGISSDVTAYDIASMPGVFSLAVPEDEQEELAQMLHTAVNEALNGFLAMRAAEGQAMSEDLLTHLNIISDDIDSISSHASCVVEEQKQKLQQRLSAILEDVEIDQNRLANELAYFADKVDINEELTRLGSHIKQFRMSLESTEPVGRKLDFILQEMLRETNTIGSKSNNLSINKLIIDVKNELERMKEQVQNVE